jgi:hypothetical protein
MRHAGVRGKGGGGANRDRTGDLLVANQTLSQLSYGPECLAIRAGGSG